MLLMAADAYNELGQTDKAITFANEVLKRARQSGNASQPADWRSGLSKEQVREKIYFERIFEGAGEPEMYQKMRLRGTEFLKKLLRSTMGMELFKNQWPIILNGTAIGENVFLMMEI